MLDNYIINDATLALVPEGENATRVIEKYVNYLVKASPITIVDESCKFYGSSFVGRCQSVKYLLGISYKCPIVISEVKDIVVFPTSSGRKEECYWFNYNGVNDYYLNNFKNYLVIVLTNGIEITIKLSQNTFANQLFKASRLMTVMKSKKS